MTAQPSLERAASRGMLWNGMGALGGKLMSLGSQLVLGWVLSPEDFGIYALAIGAATVFMAVRNGGTDQVLVQKGSQYAGYVPAVWRVALTFNIVAAALIVLLAPKLSTFYGEPQIANLLYVIAGSLLLGTPVVISRSRMLIDFRFAEIVIIDLKSAFVRYTATLGLALSGFGPLSFVLPLILVSLYEAWAFASAARRSLGASARIGHRAGWIEVFGESRWLMLAALGIAVATNGDYLVLGLFETTAEIGVYFFGFQLVAALISLFDTGARAVFLATLSGISGDIVRQREAVVRVWRVLAPPTAAVAIGSLFLAPVLIHWLWGGKWDRAILIVQLLVVMIPFLINLNLAYAVLGARALWRRRAVYLMMDAVGLVVTAGLAALLGGIEWVAGAVAFWRIVLSLVVADRVATLLGADRRFLLTINLRYLGIMGGIAAASALLATHVPVGSESTGQWLVGGLGYAIFLAMLAATLLKRETMEVTDVIRRSLGRA